MYLVLVFGMGRKRRRILLLFLLEADECSPDESFDKVDFFGVFVCCCLLIGVFGIWYLVFGIWNEWKEKEKQTSVPPMQSFDKVDIFCVFVCCCLLIGVFGI